MPKIQEGETAIAGSYKWERLLKRLQAGDGNLGILPSLRKVSQRFAGSGVVLDVKVKANTDNED